MIVVHCFIKSYITCVCDNKYCECFHTQGLWYTNDFFYVASVYVCVNLLLASH